MEEKNLLKGSIDDLKQVRTLLENQTNIKNNIAAMTAEKQKLEKEAQAEEKPSSKTYYCPTCGFEMQAEEKPDACPMCGMDMIEN